MLLGVLINRFSSNEHLQPTMSEEGCTQTTQVLWEVSSTNLSHLVEVDPYDTGPRGEAGDTPREDPEGTNLGSRGSGRISGGGGLHLSQQESPQFNLPEAHAQVS